MPDNENALQAVLDAVRNHRVVFQFDENSFDSFEDLRERGFQFREVILVHPVTNEKRKLILNELRQ